MPFLHGSPCEGSMEGLHQASWLRADPLLRIASDAQTRLLTPSKPYLTVEICCPLEGVLPS